MACDGGAPAEERVLELAHDTIRLPDGVTLHQVRVSRASAAEFEPAAVRAIAGDVIRFTAADRGGHTILFDGSILSDAVRTYLEENGQLRSPPLIDEGAAWVITLDGAPPGEYRFHCATHGAAGVLHVSGR